MKLNAEIGPDKHTITLKREGTRIHAEIDGRVYDLEARPTVNGEYLLLHEGRVYACLVQGAAVNGKAFTVSSGSRDYVVTLTDPKRLRTGAGAGVERSGQLTAQMPGKIVRVMLAAGAEVTEGTPILVVEAMKMQNEMKAPRDGVLTAVNVAPGDTVTVGDVLAVIE